MNILFKSKQLENLCNSFESLKRKFSEKLTKQISRRLLELNAAQKLSHMRNLPGKCEELKGNRQGQLSVRLDRQFRIIFEPENNPIPKKDDGGLDWEQVTAIKILEIKDYHD